MVMKMNWVQKVLIRLARVVGVAPGRADDGLVRFASAGTDLDKSWEVLAQEFTDAREAWRRNPLARRLVSLVASFVCGDGITLSSNARDLRNFIDEFWAHEHNHLALRQYGLCEELSRAGELFITLHMNPADGMSYVRAIPASSIDRVITAPGDYETELGYHEMAAVGDPDYPEGRVWAAAGAESVGGAASFDCAGRDRVGGAASFDCAGRDRVGGAASFDCAPSGRSAQDALGMSLAQLEHPERSAAGSFASTVSKDALGMSLAQLEHPERSAAGSFGGTESKDADYRDRPGPVCLHFAVNRPVGCVRGESDLAPVLPWLRRYSRWLEERCMHNSALRAFLWIVKVPGARVEEKKLQLARAPEPGSVLVVDKDNEEWEAVAPSLHASDAQSDGRAVRWMIAAGGPGVGLVDLGEGEEANLATAKAMGEQRSRFMRARQQYFAWALACIALTAYNRAVRLGKRPGKERTLADIRIGVPDISPADNGELAAAAASVAEAFAKMGELGVKGKRWQELGVRTLLKFVGEPADEGMVWQIVEGE